MKINRDLQNLILTRLAERYPHGGSRENLKEFRSLEKSDLNLAGNLLYLQGHGLVIVGEGIKLNIADDFEIIPCHIKVTPSGIDFIENDGGLSAILKTITVKISPDTLSLLDKAIEQSRLSQKDKSGLSARIRELPAYAIEHVATRLLDGVLDDPMNALQRIQSILLHLNI